MSPVHCKLSMSSARCPGPVGSSSSTSVQAIPIPNENVRLALRSRISPICSMWKVSHLPLEKTDVGAQSRIYLFALCPYCIVHICDKKQANRPSSFAVHCQFKWVRGVPNLPRAQRLDHIDYRRCIVTSRIYCALMLPHLRFALSDCKFARRQL